MTEASPRGLLLVAMEPPATLEEEFNDWYDTEHFPQRAALPGVRSASRWVCLEGWPRWLAIYDLDSVAALATPEYLAVSGANSTPWSKRILPRTLGRERIVARQTTPGDADALPPERLTRLVFSRHREQSTLAERFGATAGLLQLRLFDAADGGATLALAAYDRPVFAASLAATIGQDASAMNIYAPYRRA